MLYEDLRRDVLAGSTRISAGLALLQHRGMVAWMKAWSTYAPRELERPPAVAGAGVLPSDLKGEVTLVLASMALAGR